MAAISGFLVLVLMFVFVFMNMGMPAGHEGKEGFEDTRKVRALKFPLLKLNPQTKLFYFLCVSA